LKSFLNGKKILILFFFCLCSCASNTVIENASFVWLTNSSKYFLLPTQYIEKPMDSHQFISAFFDGRNFQTNVWVKADETGVDMVFINEMGSTMGNLSFCGKTIFFSSSVFPKTLRPEYIIADFQLCFYNASAVRQEIESSGLVFEETLTGRRILDGSGVIVIIEIIKTHNTVSLINHLRGYTYTLEGYF